MQKNVKSLNGKLNNKKEKIKYLISENEKLNKLKEELNKEKTKNDILFSQIKGLKNKLKEDNIKISILENQLKEKVDKNLILGQKINNLENELKNEIKKNVNITQNIKIEEIIKSNTLFEELSKKDKVIEELKKKLSRYPFELSEGEKLMSIIFVSRDQKIHYSIICKNTDKFNQIENKLYENEDYSEYSETDNIFIVNGLKVKKNKSLDENKIKDNDIIILDIREN